jgi:hypothetical protein
MVHTVTSQLKRLNFVLEFHAGPDCRAVKGVGLGCLVTGILGSNTARGMDGCLSLCSCVVFSRVGKGLVTGWSLVQKSPTKCLN